MLPQQMIHEITEYIWRNFYGDVKNFTPQFFFFYQKRDFCLKNTWYLSFRRPWSKFTGNGIERLLPIYIASLGNNVGHWSTITSQYCSKVVLTFEIYCFLTHCGLVMPYGVMDLDHHWFRKSPVAKKIPEAMHFLWITLPRLNCNQIYKSL